MSRYTDTKAAIVATIQVADPSCPADHIYDRTRDPKNKTVDQYKEIFAVTPTDGSLPYIQAWHFDKKSKTNGQLYAWQGGADIGLGSVSTNQETWEIEALRSWIDDPPSTYAWQEVMDVVHDVMFDSADIQELEGLYNLNLTDVSISDLGYKYLYGEAKCHVAAITLTFSRGY